MFAFDHQLEVTHSVQWVADWQLCDQGTGVERVTFLYFVRAAELPCFHDFCRHLLTNPVRYIYIYYITFSK